MESTHQLYFFTTCPFCVKVRFALWRLGLKLPTKNILTNTAYRDELVAGGGKKQVPCLRIEKQSGEVEWLYESDDIIRYLKRQVAA